MLYVFDLDNTLISSYMDNPGHEYDVWHVLPGRRGKLRDLLAAGHRVAIATNQAGVAFGHITESQVAERLRAVLAALDLPPDTPLAISYAHPHASIKRYRDPAQVARRKPRGKMIRELMAALPDAAASGVVYVGDRPEDRAAARDAHAGFQWAQDFFASPGQPA